MKQDHLTKAKHLQKRMAQMHTMLYEMFYGDYEFDPAEAAALQRAMTNANGAAIALEEFITNPDVDEGSANEIHS